MSSDKRDGLVAQAEIREAADGWSRKLV